MNGWDEWGKHVLAALKRLSSNSEKQTEKINKIHLDLSALKAKAAVWGVFGGAIITGVINLWLEK